MLIRLPPGFEAAAHADDVLEAVFQKKGGGAEAAVAVVAVNHEAFFFVGVLKKLLHVAVVQMNRPRNMRLAVGAGIANIDEQGLLLIEFSLGIMNLNLRAFHRTTTCLYLF